MTTNIETKAIRFEENRAAVRWPRIDRPSRAERRSSRRRPSARNERRPLGGLRPVHRQSLGALTVRFQNALKKGVEGIIEAGRVVIEAKAILDHGQFTNWVVDQLRFGERRIALRKAEMLKYLAQNEVISKSCHWHALPPSPRTLWELTQIRPTHQLLKMIANGKVNSGMTREEAVALREREAYRLWWEYVQLARSEYGDKTVRKKYREWGDLDAKFDDWFRDNWTKLFAVERGVKVVRDQPNRLLISVPLDEPIVHVLKAVRAELSKRQAGPRARRKIRISAAKFSIAAENLKYAPLRAYLRILALDRKHQGDRSAVVDAYYQWARQRNAKVRQWTKARKAAGQRLRVIDEAGWDKVTDRTGTRIIVARYLKKGRKIVRNTLAGQFPGKFT